MELSRENIRMIAFALRKTSENFNEKAGRALQASNDPFTQAVASLAVMRGQSYGELAAQFEDELTQPVDSKG